MKDIKCCDVCGKIVRIYGDIYCFYKLRWFEKHFITVCSDCEDVLPMETDNDKPEHWRIYDSDCDIESQ